MAQQPTYNLLSAGPAVEFRRYIISVPTRLTYTAGMPAHTRDVHVQWLRLEKWGTPTKRPSPFAHLQPVVSNVGSCTDSEHQEEEDEETRLPVVGCHPLCGEQDGPHQATCRYRQYHKKHSIKKMAPSATSVVKHENVMRSHNDMIVRL
jgi:hypothetical protein